MHSICKLIRVFNYRYVLSPNKSVWEISDIPVKTKYIKSYETSKLIKFIKPTVQTKQMYFSRKIIFLIVYCI